MARVLPWLPPILAVAALVAFTIVTIVRLTPAQTQTLPPPEPAFTLPGGTSGPQGPVSLVPTLPSSAPPIDPANPDPKPTSRTIPVVVNPPRTTAPPNDPPPNDPPPNNPPRTTPPRTTEPPRPVAVSGHYDVVNSYSDNFIGEVRLTNLTGAGQNWAVTLTYPGNLRTSWLEGLPQPTMVRRGNTYTWTSSVPLAPGSSAQMRFQFDKVNGSETPSGCSVNGASCS
ncbi:cellulose binding domain-containing protein [Actinoplanes subtropicus]|uniref:cellulose binding domain-containing protein n=1 Tax=Actinoplanes subtropicus TaxID=543632 RepID=UPI0004C3FB37|nr:cellulose binding domain-containing protein [Actinoplanes subtropicus]